MNNPNFDKFSKELQSVFNLPNEHDEFISDFDCMIKGDISGIQDFVFRVKSDKASKTLKARSYFIKIACDLCIELIKEKFGNEIKVLYNGGGNFYILLKHFPEFDERLKQIKAIINRNLWQEELSLDISHVKFPSRWLLDNFYTIWSKIQEESSLQKLNRFEDFFEAFEGGYNLAKSDREWDDFTQILLRLEDLDVRRTGKDFAVLKDEISLFEYTWKIQKGGSKNGRPFGLPLWRYGDALTKYKAEAKSEENEEDIPLEGNIISFKYLAKFAKDRTGTEKLGVLKMDVDDLGAKFNDCQSVNSTEKLSTSLKWFFESYLLEDLIGQGTFTYLEPTESSNIEEGQEPTTVERIAYMRDNIYVVFSGGDDTFLIGAWDAVFKLTGMIRQEFERMAGKNLTLSAALLLVGSHFPVVRMADLAEEALYEAKTIIPNSKGKVCVFDKVLSWPYFQLAEQNAATLQSLIQISNEPRSILEKLRRSSNQIRRIIIDVKNGKSGVPPLWKLFYSIRNTHNRDKIEELVKEYYAAIVLAYTDKTENPLYTETLPVAVRWAEFLTRNIFFNKK